MSLPLKLETVQKLALIELENKQLEDKIHWSRYYGCGINHVRQWLFSDSIPVTGGCTRLVFAVWLICT